VIALAAIATLAAAPVACPPTIQALAERAWDLRARTMPFSSDDIPRLERPPGLVRSWSRKSVEQQRFEWAALRACLRRLPEAGLPVPLRVDRRLIGSLFARVEWELDVNRRWERDPTFYLEQTLTPVLELLVQPPPIDEPRARELLLRLHNVPALIADGKENLRGGVRRFAQLALDSLQEIRPKLQRVESGVGPLLPPSVARAELAQAIDSAASALESYRALLEARSNQMVAKASVGRAAYEFFLRQVALVPYTPEQLIAMAQQEWERSMTAEALEQQRNSGAPLLAYFGTLDEQIARCQKDELSIRKFLEERSILSVPASVRHYTVQPIPGYLDALGDFGEQDFFTGPSALDQDAVRYLYPPSPRLGYFGRVNARDPRPILTHEGVPGHYFQLALSWTHPDPIRRHYYDSGANEGLGFYAEEMMMQAGLYDDSPRSREIIWGLNRLRAARVYVDVQLALGSLTLEQAAQVLSDRAPMDPRTARNEAASFSTNPGQAMTYQIGKLQIEKFLAESRFRQGDKFDLRRFHDALWLNGNVPIALQRWEALGDDDEIRWLDAGAEASGQRH
jgi:hypothetical protein